MANLLIVTFSRKVQDERSLQVVIMIYMRRQAPAQALEQTKRILANSIHSIQKVQFFFFFFFQFKRALT